MKVSYLKTWTCYRVAIAWLSGRSPDIALNKTEALTYGSCEGGEWIYFYSADDNYCVNFDDVHQSGHYDFSLSVRRYSEEQDKFILFWGECKHYAAADELLANVL